jgi:predicted ribosomally synthesized peptide with nif11-like leader
MTDEPLTQADQFLEHAIRDESLAAQLRNADFATVARIALGLGYQFTEEEFAETLEEYKDEQLDDAMLEHVVGGIDPLADDDDEEEETDVSENTASGKHNIGTELQNFFS